jgi:hypothetical protein
MPAVDIPTKYPWLRTDPGTLSGEPPSKVSGIIASSWEQVFGEWLRGTTGGQPNWQSIDADSDENGVVAQYVRLGFPSTTDEERAALVAKFQGAYGSFRFDIANIQRSVADRAKEIRAAAKAANQPVPSDREARKKAGHEVAKDVMRTQLKAQSNRLGDLNVALVANLQLKTFQTSALQQFKIAINSLDEAKWDEVPEDTDEESAKPGRKPSPEKAVAMAGLRDAGTAMFAAYGRVSAVIAQIARLDGAAIPEGTDTELAESMMEFGQAIAAMSRSIGEAARHFGKWIRRTTRAFIRENFSAIHPGIATGFFAMRTLLALASSVGSAFPEFGGVVLSAVSAAEGQVENCIIFFMAWEGGKDTETQKKYALRQFEVSQEYKDNLIVKSVEYKKKFDDAVASVTTDLVAKGVGKVTDKMKAMASAGLGTGKTEELARIANDGYEFLGPMIDFGKEMGGVPSVDPVSMVTGTTPVLGLAKTGMDTFFGAAELYVAYHSELVDRPDVTAEDRARIEALIDAPPQNEGYLLFALSNEAELVKPVGFPRTQVRSGGVLFTVNMEDLSVVISEPSMFNEEMRGYAQKWAKNPPNDNNGLRYMGVLYVPDWSTFQLDPADQKKSPFRATLNAVHPAARGDEDCTLVVAVDLDFNEVAILSSSYVPVPSGLDDTIEYNANPPKGKAPHPLTSDVVKMHFAGKSVAFNGVDYILGQEGAVIIDHPDDWSMIGFTMEGTAADGSRAMLELDYTPGLALRAFKATPLPGAAADLAAFGALIAANDAQQNTPMAQFKHAGAMAAKTVGDEAAAKQAYSEVVKAEKAAPEQLKHAERALGRAVKDAAKAATEVTRTKTVAADAKARADAAPAKTALAEAKVKADVAVGQAVRKKADADAEVQTRTEERDHAQAEIPRLKAEVDAKKKALDVASAAKLAADTDLKAKRKAAGVPEQKTGLKTTFAALRG